MKSGILVLSVALSLPAGSEDLKTQPAPLYRVTVVGRAAKVVNYGHRGRPTKIDFRGTVLLPETRGEATVQSTLGAVQIDTRFKRLDPPTRFGREYLTYVLWALTPDGRAANLGEIVTDEDNRGRLKVTTQLQAFALIVTAEPHFAVTQPSNVVVLENVLRKDTEGKVEDLEVKYELLSRGDYTFHADSSAGHHRRPESERKVSLDQYEALLALYQARNALQIARAEGAGQYARETFQKAERLLADAESHQAGRAGTRLVVTTAREAAQTAEDARAISAKRRELEQLARQQPAGEQR